MPHNPTDKQKAFLLLDCMDAFYGGSAGGGKVQTLNSHVITPFGIKEIGDIQAGDKVCNPDGSVASVLIAHPIKDYTKYTLYFHDGTKAECGKDHLWKAWKARGGSKKAFRYTCGEAGAKIYTTSMLVDMHNNKNTKVLLPVTHEVPFNISYRYRSKISPYMLGTLLGDGCITRKGISITSMEPETKIFLDHLGIDYRISSKPNNKAYGYIFRYKSLQFYRAELEKLDLQGCNAKGKFIPRQFKFWGVEQRYQLIQGLMDTDGYIDNRGQIYYTTISKQLAEDMAFVLRSLGGVVTITNKIPQYSWLGEKYKGQKAYTLYIKHRHPEKLVTLPRRKARLANAVSDIMFKRIEHIEISAKKVPMRCITVDHLNGLYLTNDFTVTHNSDALLMCALQYVDTPGYNALLLRDSFRNLTMPESLISRSEEWLSDTDAKWQDKTSKWVFPSGATLSFGYLYGPRDHLQFKSSAFQFVGIDEASDLRWNQMRYLFSRLRRLKGVKIPIRFRLASNPGGISHEKLLEWYINPETRKPNVIFIPASMYDNPYLDHEEYNKALDNLSAIDRQRLKMGDWTIKEHGRLFKRFWFQTSNFPPVRADIVRTVRYWDLASTEPSKYYRDPDFTVGVKVHLTKQGFLYIEDLIRFRYTTGLTEKMIENTATLDGKKTHVYIEQDPGSAGKSVVDHYSRDILPNNIVYGNRITGNKINRSMLVSSRAEKGHVFLVMGEWTQKFLDELELFPDGTHDDQVDAVSGAIDVLTNKLKAGRFLDVDDSYSTSEIVTQGLLQKSF